MIKLTQLLKELGINNPTTLKTLAQYAYHQKNNTSIYKRLVKDAADRIKNNHSNDINNIYIPEGIPKFWGTGEDEMEGFDREKWGEDVYTLIPHNHPNINELGINNPNKLTIYTKVNPDEFSDYPVWIILPNKDKYEGHVDEDLLFFNLNDGTQSINNSKELLIYLSQFGINPDNYDIDEPGTGIEISLDKVNIKNIND